MGIFFGAHVKKQLGTRKQHDRQSFILDLQLQHKYQVVNRCSLD